MTKRSLRLPPLAALLAALTLSACGGSEGPVTRGESEAAHVQAGDLLYQVQLSRALNPHAVDDTQYLDGVEDSTLTHDQQWFGVWIKVFNMTDQPQQATDEFRVVDAAGNEYEPVAIADNNPFQYEARTVQDGDDNGLPIIPHPNSIAASGAVHGSLLLFKVPHSIYQNVPVEFEVFPPAGGDPSMIVLDM